MIEPTNRSKSLGQKVGAMGISMRRFPNLVSKGWQGISARLNRLRFNLHCPSYSCMVRQFDGIFMSAIRNNSLLLLAFFGVVGCSNMERLYYRPASVVSAVPLRYAPNSLSSSNINPPPYVVSDPSGDEQPIVKEAAPRPSVRDEIPAHVLKYFERKPEIAEVPEKSTAPSPASAQSESKVIADNRLLELLEKDLNKAVELPKERRRLQFSKQVIDDQIGRAHV